MTYTYVFGMERDGHQTSEVNMIFFTKMQLGNITCQHADRFLTELDAVLVVGVF